MQKCRSSIDIFILNKFIFWKGSSSEKVAALMDYVFQELAVQQKFHFK